jgi:hypothetical protein
MALIEWKDPSAWMEKMSGPRWKARVARENKKYEAAIPGDSEDFKAATDAFAAASEEWEAASTWTVTVGTTKLKIYPQNGGVYHWSTDGKENPLAGDLDLASGGIVVYSHEVSGGGEEYEIRATKNGKSLWTYRTKHGLAASVAIIKRRVYLLEAVSPLSYKYLISVDLMTGKDRRVHYEEADENYAISIIRGENECLFLTSENAGRERLYHVTDKVTQLSADGDSFYPVGYGSGSTEPCYFVKREGRWRAEGAALKRLRLPDGFDRHGIDYAVLSNGLFIYRNHGERCIYHKGRSTKILGEVEINPWGLCKGSCLDMHITIPGRAPILARIDDKKGLVLGEPPSVSGGTLTGMAKSADGSKVRWILVSDRNRPVRGVIVSGYGAYGMTTQMNTARWKPYLERGIAIGLALVRGGGDDNDEWAEAGRRQGKLQGVEDLEACVRAIQGVLGLGPERTCLFGRSAGGYLVGAAVTRSPEGQLFRHVYTEVPYVDVLRAGCRPDYPLTKYEYMEFGDPVHVIADFETMLRLGPVSGLGPKGAPGVFVLSRVGLNDRQVYPYESVKWMDALKGDNLLAIGGGHGHFTVGARLFEERAADFLILVKRILG